MDEMHQAAADAAARMMEDAGIPPVLIGAALVQPSSAEAFHAATDSAREHIRRQQRRLESELAEAMALQDFDRLDDLAVVHVIGQGPAVASILRANLPNLEAS